MAEAQRFECPGRYFGRYCTDEREYNYARILESSNEHTLKALDRWSIRADEILKKGDKLMEYLLKKYPDILDE